MQVTFPVHDHRTGLQRPHRASSKHTAWVRTAHGPILHGISDFDKTSAKIKKSNAVLGFESKRVRVFHLPYKSLGEPTV